MIGRGVFCFPYEPGVTITCAAAGARSIEHGGGAALQGTERRRNQNKRRAGWRARVRIRQLNRSRRQPHNRILDDAHHRRQALHWARRPQSVDGWRRWRRRRVRQWRAIGNDTGTRGGTHAQNRSDRRPSDDWRRTSSARSQRHGERRAGPGRPTNGRRGGPCAPRGKPGRRRQRHLCLTFSSSFFAPPSSPAPYSFLRCPFFFLVLSRVCVSVCDLIYIATPEDGARPPQPSFHSGRALLLFVVALCRIGRLALPHTTARTAPMAASCRPCVARQAEGFRWRRHTRSSLFCATLVTRGGATHPHTGRGGGAEGTSTRWSAGGRRRKENEKKKRPSVETRRVAGETEPLSSFAEKSARVWHRRSGPRVGGRSPKKRGH